MTTSAFVDRDLLGDSPAQAESRARYLQELRHRWRLVEGRTPQESGPLTSIVILTHNNRWCTEICLTSLRLFTPQPYEVLVVDNGSTDDTLTYLREQGDIRLFENPINRGFPAGCNLGMHHARGEQILLLNNDVIVTPGWLASLTAGLRLRDDVGLAGPLSNNVSGEQCIPVRYETLAALESFARGWCHDHAGEIRNVNRLVGFCLLVRRSIVEKIGLLDERFGMGMFEDDDYVLRARAAGFRAVIVRDAFVHHFGSASFLALGHEWAVAQYERNQALFIDKWRGRFPARVASTPSPSPLPAPAQHTSGEAADTTGRPSITLAMIVRDNEATIRPCLESIRPWVDEMVVVDTGSRDATPNIARSLGARVFDFPWCDSFSAARNASLNQARGEWIFWMDSDDTIDEANGRKLRELLVQPPEADVLGFVMQVHCPGPPGDASSGLTVVDHVKLFRNLPELRFEGRIHEQILPAINRREGKVVWTDIFVVHSGYDHTPEGQERKKERDLKLLHLELAEQPDHPFTLFNLGMTYTHIGRHQEAIPFLQRTIALSAPQESHVRKAHALLVHALKEADRTDAALAACEQALGLYPDDPELLFRHGLLLHSCGRLEEAAQAYQRLLSAQPERKFSSLDPGIRSFKARQNLAAVYVDMGDFARAEEQSRSIVAEAPQFRPGWRGLGDILVRRGKLVEAEAVAAQLIDGPFAAEGWLLRSRIAREAGDFEAGAAALQQARNLDADDLEPLRQMCQILFEHGRPEHAEAALRELAEREGSDGAPWHNLGTLYLRMGRLADAIAAYRQAIDRRPAHFQTWLYLASALASAGDQSGARSSLQQAAQLAQSTSERADLAAYLAVIDRQREP